MSTKSGAEGKGKEKEILFKGNSRINKHCHQCQKPQEPGMKPFQACSRCKEIIYCSRECQKLNWPHHKLPCSKSAEIKKQLNGKNEALQDIAKFRRWFETPNKINILRQAILHALKATTHPENVDRKVFILEFTLKDDHESQAAVDKYRLVKGQMFPKEVLFDAMDVLQRTQLTSYIGGQNEMVKKRGQLGVVPVLMKNGEADYSNSWLPLALPMTMEDAVESLQTCGWDDDIFWVTRLRQIFDIPESKMELAFPDGDASKGGFYALPKSMRKRNFFLDFNMADTIAQAVERNVNDPNYDPDSE